MLPVLSSCGPLLHFVRQVRVGLACSCLSPQLFTIPLTYLLFTCVSGTLILPTVFNFTPTTHPRNSSEPQRCLSSRPSGRHSLRLMQSLTIAPQRGLAVIRCRIDGTEKARHLSIPDCGSHNSHNNGPRTLTISIQAHARRGACLLQILLGSASKRTRA